MEEIEIKIKNLCKDYIDTNKQTTTVLNHINLDIKKGEFISLLGPSGCGKTTLLRTIADLIKPTSGEITISGVSAKEAKLKHKYAMVFQNPVLYDWRTVRENIALPLEMMRIPKDEQNRIVEKQLQVVDLQGYGNRYPYELSGGMQQRVGIARALALNPEILLMDEPFSALDEFTKERLHNDLLNIWQRNNKTIIFVTHNISEAVYLSDRVCVLSANPARLSAVIDIHLPRPRSGLTLKSKEYFDLVTKTRDLFGEEYNGNI